MYLIFRFSDPREMQQWIDTINFVAACFSSPPLPAPISARQSFHRPFLPSAPTKLSMSEQWHDHESRIIDIQKQLSQHRNDAPSRSAKPRTLQMYAEKEVFLIYEVTFSFMSSNEKSRKSLHTTSKFFLA